VCWRSIEYALRFKTRFRLTAAGMVFARSCRTNRKAITGSLMSPPRAALCIRVTSRLTTAAGSGDPSFQDTIKRASKTTARIRSSKKAAKITVSRMVPQSDRSVTGYRRERLHRLAPPILLGLALHRWRSNNSGSLAIFAAIRRASSVRLNLIGKN
jgi:hypothetical protein